MRSAGAPGDLPTLRFPRVAFVGRSNVGKSSLLNRMLGVKALARVSRTPGRTRLVNYFMVNETLVFMDMPGYGYARVPREMRQAWRGLSESALLKDGGPAVTFLLMDARHAPTPLDAGMAEWLTALGLGWIGVLTKFDKLKAGERISVPRRVRKELQADRIVATSARTGFGMDDLWKELDVVETQHRTAPRTGGEGTGV